MDCSSDRCACTRTLDKVVCINVLAVELELIKEDNLIVINSIGLLIGKYNKF